MTLPTVTLGIPACKKHISVVVLIIIAIILICVGRGAGVAGFCARVPKGPFTPNPCDWEDGDEDDDDNDDFETPRATETANHTAPQGVERPEPHAPQRRRGIPTFGGSGVPAEPGSYVHNRTYTCCSLVSFLIKKPESTLVLVLTRAESLRWLQGVL